MPLEDILLQSAFSTEFLMPVELKCPDLATAANFLGTAEATGPWLDLQQLVDRCLGNLELVDSLLGSFADRLDGSADRLQQAVAQGDLPLAARLAHRLKGEAGNLGALRLLDLASGLEAAARRGDQVAADAAALELNNAVGEFLRKAFTFRQISDDGASVGPRSGRRLT
jgi:HPt (histidine-containing phosphotransfer) domain-containing protein